MQRPDHAFILAAGKGTRLRPYTDTMPKPMVAVDGQALIDHALDHLAGAGVRHVTINTHYMADKLENHLSQRLAPPTLMFSREETLLDTGGGIKKALSTMGDRPFFAVSGDGFWTDSSEDTALSRLCRAWDEETMDILLLLQPLSRMVLTRGVGDYDLTPDGRAIRSLDKKGAYMWTSIRLCRPGIFNDTPDDAFSFLELMDRAQSQGRLYGLVHDADWHHISTPEDLDRVAESLAAPRPRDTGT